MEHRHRESKVHFRLGPQKLLADIFHSNNVTAFLLGASGEVDKPRIRYSLLGEAECNIFALEVLEDPRVLSLGINGQYQITPRQRNLMFQNRTSILFTNVL
jgi:hypothetical protein